MLLTFYYLLCVTSDINDKKRIDLGENSNIPIIVKQIKVLD